jgi:hypothetical protein
MALVCGAQYGPGFLREMTEMDKLKELIARCKCGVFLTVNEHRDYYKTVAEILDDAMDFECPPEIAPDVEEKMIETDTIVRLHFYPDTPIGSYEIWHYDIDSALDEALACLTPTGN